MSKDVQIWTLSWAYLCVHRNSGSLPGSSTAVSRLIVVTKIWPFCANLSHRDVDAAKILYCWIKCGIEVVACQSRLWLLNTWRYDGVNIDIQAKLNTSSHSTAWRCLLTMTLSFRWALWLNSSHACAFAFDQILFLFCWSQRCHQRQLLDTADWFLNYICHEWHERRVTAFPGPILVLFPRCF